MVLFDAYNIDESMVLLRGGDVLDSLTLLIYDNHGNPLPYAADKLRSDNGVQIVLCIEELSIP
eukprot:1744736-Pleurochrysis_carterae.AAC.1